MWVWAGPKPDFKVWGENKFLGGQDFCSYYMFKIIFLGTTKFRKTQKNLGCTAPECLFVATGLGVGMRSHAFSIVA